MAVKVESWTGALHLPMIGRTTCESGEVSDMHTGRSARELEVHSTGRITQQRAANASRAYRQSVLE